MGKLGPGEPLRFRGTPGNLSAPASDDPELPRRLGLRVAVDRSERWKGSEGELAARAVRIGSDLTWQLSLPPRTPPGTYEAVLELGDEERPVVIEVEEEIELQASPDQLTIAGAPGQHIDRTIAIANAGNVRVEIRKAYAFGVFASGGLERALHRAYTEDPPEGERRIDHLAEMLREEHGGIIRVGIAEGSGPLEPGESTDVEMSFHLPPDLKPGRSYTGTLPIFDLRYYVRIHVNEREEPVPRLR